MLLEITAKSLIIFLLVVSVTKQKKVQRSNLDQLILKCIFTAAILVTGGNGAPPGNSLISEWHSWTAELLHEDGSPWCSLPKLPDTRFYHTQSGLELCGGLNGPSTCLKFSQGSWITSHNLQHPRYWQSSWASPSGVVLMGGRTFTGSAYVNYNHTELLSEDDDTTSTFFSLRNGTQ